jgi:ribose-phosphate pyrophosphokinase
METMEAAGTKSNAAQATVTASATAPVVTQPSEKKQQPGAEPKARPVRPRGEDKWKIFSGTANDALAKEVCEKLGLPLGQANIMRFSDGETYVQIMENVRGTDVFLIQPTCDPVDLHLMQLLLLIDALKRASARRITVVIPYFGYARQDRKDRPRVPISSKLVADLLTTAGADRALVVDLHAPQIQGFFNIPVDHLFASPVLVGHFRELELPDLTVVSPDAGGVERARFFAKKMNSALAIVDKRRVGMDETEVMHVIGDVEGRTCVILDDIIDTAGTLVKTGEALVDAGARQVYACATHAVLSGPAIERISKSVLIKVVVTNTIPLTEAGRNEPKIRQLSIAGLIASAIQSIHEETSVSRLFL